MVNDVVVGRQLVRCGWLHGGVPCHYGRVRSVEFSNACVHLGLDERWCSVCIHDHHLVVEVLDHALMQASLAVRMVQQ